MLRKFLHIRSSCPWLVVSVSKVSTRTQTIQQQPSRVARMAENGMIELLKVTTIGVVLLLLVLVPWICCMHEDSESLEPPLPTSAQQHVGCKGWLRGYRCRWASGVSGWRKGEISSATTRGHTECRWIQLRTPTSAVIFFAARVYGRLWWANSAPTNAGVWPLAFMTEWTAYCRNLLLQGCTCGDTSSSSITEPVGVVTNCRIFDLEQTTMGLRDSRFNDPAEE